MRGGDRVGTRLGLAFGIGILRLLMSECAESPVMAYCVEKLLFRN